MLLFILFNHLKSLVFILLNVDIQAYVQRFQICLHYSTNPLCAFQVLLSQIYAHAEKLSSILKSYCYKSYNFSK